MVGCKPASPASVSPQNSAGIRLTCVLGARPNFVKVAPLIEAARRTIVPSLALNLRRYALCTLHRPSNVDTASAATNMLEALEVVANAMPTVLPLHPRTRSRLQDFGLLERLERQPNFRVTEPLGYLDFLCLMDQARVVLTDSGGIQEETTALGVPCMTFRESTERPITVAEGSNVVVGIAPSAVADELSQVLARPERVTARLALWDGRAAERIVAVLAQHYCADKRAQ
jgi:UDP-N-acetylglucosamine 2-epimerase (non-hydrolysing)